MKKPQKHARARVDDLLQQDKPLRHHEVKWIKNQLAVEDVVEKAESAKVVPAWLVRQRKRNLREQLRRLGKLKRGQVYVLRWPKMGWVNGHPTTWLAYKGLTASERWQQFLKDHPPALYHDSGCLPEEVGKGAGMGYEVLKVNAYELAGVGCGGCGVDLEGKGRYRERQRERAKKLRVRKPTKPRDLLSVAQVVRQMREQDARIKKLR